MRIPGEGRDNGYIHAQLHKYREDLAEVQVSESSKKITEFSFISDFFSLSLPVVFYFL